MAQRAALKTCIKIFDTIGANCPETYGVGFSGFFGFVGFPLEIQEGGDVTRVAETSLG